MKYDDMTFQDVYDSMADGLDVPACIWTEEYGNVYCDEISQRRYRITGGPNDGKILEINGTKVRLLNPHRN